MKTTLINTILIFFCSTFLFSQTIDSTTFERVIENGDTTIVETIHYNYEEINLDEFIGQQVPNFEATDLDGIRHEIARYEGQVLVLYFWSVYDQSTWEECDSFERLYQAYFDQGLAVLGLCNDNIENATGFLEKRPMPYPVIAHCHAFGAAFFGGEKGNPRVFVVDKLGIIRQALLGGNSHEPMQKYNKLKPIIEELLKE